MWQLEFNVQAMNACFVLWLYLSPLSGILFLLLYRLRKEEIQALAGPNEYAEFRQRLTAIDKFYAQHPNEVIFFKVFKTLL